MPKFLPGICFITSDTIFVISCGSVPPLVSHKIIHLAPWSNAAFKHFNAYSGFALYPSKKCSASNMNSLPELTICFVLSLIFSKFSSLVIPSATST